jgi:AcrR family transcriptional regulator
MALPKARDPRPKAGKRQYHHGDLRRALLEEAVRTIRHEGVPALTLRAVGGRLGVSRTALYRHFADKSALLNAVAEDGFRRLSEALSAAWKGASRGEAGFAAMGRAYVNFASDNPSHYRVMFGSSTGAECDAPGLQAQAARAFQILVDALTELQQAGRVRREDTPQQLALHTWSVVHGISMLGIDGRLPGGAEAVAGLTEYAVRRIGTGIFA